MTDCVTLYYHDVAPLRPFHSASVTLRRRGEDSVSRHRHDFHEAMLVVEGSGRHWLNDAERNLTAGELFLLRPDDRHGITLGGSPRLHFMNIAFPSAAWYSFAGIGLPDDVAASWRADAGPRTARLTGDRFDRALAAFRRLSQFGGQPDERIELVRLWMEIVTLLREDSSAPAATVAEGPAWLARALDAMSRGDHLQAGVPALVELAGVSPAHVSRTLKSLHGVTPTEFVNSVRLRRAAMLLANSSLDIVDIALECGFDNLSYFYRKFRSAYGRAPRAYRLAERMRVAPHAPNIAG